jgi:hypothetical protein
MQAIVHAADIQDRDGGVLLMGALFGLYPFLPKLYADSGYQGPNFQVGLRSACRQVNLEIVKRSDRHRFVVLPKRWIVDRTIAVDVYVDQSLPTAGQGLGVPEPQRPRIPAPGLRPSHASKAMPRQQMIPDGHLGSHHHRRTAHCPEEATSAAKGVRKGVGGTEYAARS